MRNGYEMVYMPSHHRADCTGCVYKHIVVAEEKLGRLLKNSECVHHLNEIRNDNRKENLIVFKTIGDHAAFHHGCEIEMCGDVYVAKTHPNNICPICGRYKDCRAKFCIKCSLIKRRKVDRPCKEELIKLIINNTFVKIGKMYGVSGNTIRKWCKFYDLPYKQEDIKKYYIN